VKELSHSYISTYFGIREGSVLALFLFVIYLDDLAKSSVIKPMIIYNYVCLLSELQRLSSKSVSVKLKCLVCLLISKSNVLCICSNISCAKIYTSVNVYRTKYCCLQYLKWRLMKHSE